MPVARSWSWSVPARLARAGVVVVVALTTPRCRLAVDAVDAGSRVAEAAHAPRAVAAPEAPVDAGVERTQPVVAVAPAPADDVVVAPRVGPSLDHRPVEIPPDQEPLPTVPAAERPIGYNVPPSAPAR